jgi:hypothetical protein
MESVARSARDARERWRVTSNDDARDEARVGCESTRAEGRRAWPGQGHSRPKQHKSAQTSSFEANRAPSKTSSKTDMEGVYTPPSSPSRTIHRSHLPLEGILEVQISQNIRGEVLI